VHAACAHAMRARRVAFKVNGTTSAVKEHPEPTRIGVEAAAKRPPNRAQTRPKPVAPPGKSYVTRRASVIMLRRALKPRQAYVASRVPPTQARLTYKPAFRPPQRQ